MKIGIDISQLAYQGTGVARYMERFVESLIKADNTNEYVLFFSSFRRKLDYSIFKGLTHLIKTWEGQAGTRVKLIQYPFPPTVLDILWNRFHILPIERLIGDVDVFISSDWVQPPSRKAKMVTVLYDLIIYKYPQETAQKIVDTQKSRLNWVRKECDKVICISKSTKKDAMEILGIPEEKLRIVFPGV